jgi:hypothetical protein
METALPVTAAAALLEAAPFLLASAAIADGPLRRIVRLRPFFACGCETGPSARSLPAAAATWLVFGPLVAGARLAAAIVAARATRTGTRDCPHEASPLSSLHAMLPVALCAAVGATLFPSFAGFRHDGLQVAVAGALFAFFSAPCAIGAVAFAAMLRSTMPSAAIGYLCVAGIVDARSFMRARVRGDSHDAVGYALLALACACVSAHRGSGLVHPLIALALAPCAAGSALAAYRFRSRSCAKLRIAPALMLAGSMLGAPLPQYHATETTLADAFAGESLDFTGVITRTGSAVTLVRYAITCCRADAAPMVVRLESSPRGLRGWVRARGVFVQSAGNLELRTKSVEPVTPPADPFVYR